MGVDEPAVATWSVPVGDGSFDTWRGALCDTFLEMRAVRSTGAGFWGQIETIDDPLIKLTRVRSASITVSRDRRQASNATSERVYVIHMIDGAGTITQAGHDRPLQPGGVCVVDGTVPFALDFHTAHDVFSYQLDRSDLLGGGLALATQRRDLLPEDPVVDLMLHQMHALHAVRMRPHHRQVLANSFRDLVRLTLRGESALPDSHGVRAARRQRVIEMIETNFRRPDLSVGAVATQLAVTPRYIHALLEPTGLSFSERVRGCRLDWAAANLRSSTLTVAAIAADAGFGDLSTFHRHFRERFGQPPGRYRAGVQTTARR